jgi:hypothetical protein
MKPNDTKDTIWYLMDDVKVMKDLDLGAFEEEFKLSQQRPVTMKGRNNNRDTLDSGDQEPKKSTKLASLLDNTRLKNVAICRRKLPDHVPIPDLVRAINALDLNTISMETVELLQRLVPQEAEIKAFR